MTYSLAVRLFCAGLDDAGQQVLSHLSHIYASEVVL